MYFHLVFSFSVVVTDVRNEWECDTYGFVGGYTTMTKDGSLTSLVWINDYIYTRAPVVNNTYPNYCWTHGPVDRLGYIILLSRYLVDYVYSGVAIRR